MLCMGTHRHGQEPAFVPLWSLENWEAAAMDCPKLLPPDAIFKLKMHQNVFLARALPGLAEELTLYLDLESVWEGKKEEG